MGIARKTLLALTLAVLPAAALATAATPASAATPAAHWMVISQPAPTYFHADENKEKPLNFYWISAMNDGGAATSGKITLKDTLPAGVTVRPRLVEIEAGRTEERPGVIGTVGVEGFQYPRAAGMECNVSGSPQTVVCTSESSVPIGERAVVRIDVNVPEGAVGPLENTVTIEGGGAPAEAATSNSTPVVPAGRQAPYGVQFEGEVTQEDGQPATQAGSHPFAFATQLATNVGKVNPKEIGPPCGPQNAQGLVGCPGLAGATKDVEVELPPGLLGDSLAVPRCSQKTFQASEAGHSGGCPVSTQVGEVYLAFFGNGTHEQFAPIFNIEPPPGQPAELGFTVGGTAKIPILFHVRSDGNYGVTVDLNEVSDLDAVRLASMMIWGVPAAEAHNPMRESLVNHCNPGEKPERGCPPEAGELPAKPYLTMPSSCSGQALGLPISSDSWEAPQPPGEGASSSPEAMLAPITGCEALSLFAPEVSEVTGPEIGVAATTHQAGTPAGYDVQLQVPQNENPQDLATPDIRNVEVTLPEGTVVNPSAANGLVACTTSPEPGRPEGEFGRRSGMEGACPSQSLIGHVTIETPLLEKPVEGDVYVGQPECSPCSGQQAGEGKLVKVLIEAMPADERGMSEPPVLVKLEGHTLIDQATGRLTTIFDNNPQLPFSDLKVELEKGPDAPLVNPSSCGPVAAQASLTPWSGTPAVQVSSPPVSIEGCVTPTFAPSFTAGMSGSAQAAGFSPFAFTLTRPDGQQTLGAVTVHMPPGLAGMVSHVTQCAEAQANAGTCPAASEIGGDSVVVGPGSQPYTITGGKVFFTGPYKGAPFGLSIVTPASAGPFTLAGNTGTGSEVVRAAISVDPATAAVTVTSAPLPTVLDGIPLDIQKVVVKITREQFLFNPTDCDPMSVAATITSSTGASVNGTYPFQAVNCAVLPFHPTFRASTQGSTSKTRGASLDVKVGSASGQANIRYVRVNLPKQLPSRLDTLKLACKAAVFAADPASCPAASAVGTATAMTPVLSHPLSGPAYIVSHGGAGFPDVEIVLQGEGITLILDGKTDIDEKTNITTSTFETVPDVPVTNFELKLPEGPHSVLGAPGGNLCSQSLAMPTLIRGQNGAQIQQNTKIAVTGCRPAIRVLGHHVTGSRATIRVSVPAAGTLVATGRDISRSVKHAAKAGTVTIAVSLTPRRLRVLAHNPHQRINALVKLSFRPTHGTLPTARVRLLMG